MILEKHTHAYLSMNTPITPVSCFALSTVFFPCFKKARLHIKAAFL